MAFIETGEHGGESRSWVERKIRCSVLVVLFCKVQGPGVSQGSAEQAVSSAGGLEPQAWSGL